MIVFCLSELGTPELSSLETFTCGAFAGIMASVATQPADVVKTRLQLFPHKYNNTGSAVFSVFKVIKNFSQVLSCL